MNESDEPNDYLWDGSGPPDPEIRRLEDVLRPLRHAAPLREPAPPKRKSRRVAWAIGGALAIAAAVIAVVLARGGSACDGDDGMAFIGTGAVGCGDTHVARGVLPVGATLDTGANTATLRIATIGVAQLGTDTRVRLVATSATGHNLHLERGSMHARVSAPPRLFAITTPSTAVTDLGCEYDIHVDARGAGAIRVLSGKVELAADAHGAIVVAPAGTRATIRPGRIPGVPLATGASPALVAAVADYETGQGAGAIDRILDAATASDAITIVNLAVLEPANAAIRARLAILAPPNDAKMSLEAWRDAIVDAQIAFDALIDH